MRAGLIPALHTPFVRAWLLCGALHASYATALTTALGGNAGGLWRYVASAPLGDAANGWGIGGVIAGLAVHMAVMAAMVAAGLWLARRPPLGDVAPWKAGTLYGLALYGVMYGAVMQWRFGVPFPDPDKLTVALGLFPHVFLVGIPVFVLARRAMNTSPPS